ncbi:hypothetical protein BBJ28_00001737 [Nothophytophthora sp. Chile5]|nr:hypothetical protein BBJ28_00001737 [Nothophytophthora sp. Chile5]
MSPTDVWVDVPDTSVVVDLPNEAVVMISYDVSVSHITELEPEGVRVAEVSELSFRVVVDGSPYRQSATTVDDCEPLVAVASGYLVLEITRGPHNVRLQWRKRGTHVVKWAVASDVLDGFAGGRNMIVSAQHRFIWHTQPINAVSLLSVDKWEAVPGMVVRFRLLEAATVRFFYQLPMCMLTACCMFGADAAAYDEIETVLEVNGLRYRETGSYGIVEGAKKSTVQLQGSVIMNLVPGNGDRNDFLLFSGTLSSVNAFLAQVWYRSYLNWYGDDELRLKVADQGVTGFTAATTDEISVTIHIASVNDVPQLLVPTTQFFLEDQQISIFGVRVHDVDPGFPYSNSTFEIQLYVLSGVITLFTTAGVDVIEGDGVSDQIVRFRGGLRAVNAAIFELKYQPDTNFNSQQHVEQLGIRVHDFNYLDGTVTEAFKSILLEIQSRDDPVLMVPLELSTITIRGYAIQSSAGATGAAMLFARLFTMTPFGQIQFSRLSNTFSSSVSKLPEGDEPSSWIELSGPTEEVGAIVKSIVFSRAPTFYGYEVLFVRLSPLPDFSIVEDSSVQLGLHGNRSNNFFSNPIPYLYETSWTAKSISQLEGPRSGGTQVVVQGEEFPNDVALECLFGEAASPARFLSPTSVMCQAPMVDNETSQVPLKLTTNGQEFSQPFLFTYRGKFSAG